MLKSSTTQPPKIIWPAARAFAAEKTWLLQCLKAPLRNLLSLFCQEGGLFQPKSVTVISYYSSFISIMVLSATTLGVGWRPGSAWQAPSGVEVDDPGHHVDCLSYILLGVDFSDICHIDGHLPMALWMSWGSQRGRRGEGGGWWLHVYLGAAPGSGPVWPHREW